MGAVQHHVLLVVGETSEDPIGVEIEGYGLTMAVANKTSLRLLGPQWDARGFYILLGRSEDPDHYTAYVGEAALQPLKTRVRQHVRGNKNWDRVLLVTGKRFDSAAIGYLEGRIYDVLKNAAAADLLNKEVPRDETLPEARRATLDRYAEPVTLALRALGCPPDTPDQLADPRLRPRRVFTESVSDLVDAGLLRVGTRLRPTRRRHTLPATVNADGTLQVDGSTYGSVSAAAQAVSGNRAEPGWEFWASSSGDGSMVPLSELRDRLRQQAPGPERPVDPDPASVREMPTPAPAPPAITTVDPSDRSRARPRRFQVTLKDLIEADKLAVGEELWMLRRKHADVRATVLPDGSLTIGDQTYRSLSTAAQRTTGNVAEPGWEVWGVRRDGRTIRMDEVRADHLAATDPGAGPQ